MHLVRLQHGREEIVYSVHAIPNTSSNFGIQGADVLALAGFRRSACTLERGECFVSVVPSDLRLSAFGNALVIANDRLEQARSHLESCGIVLEQPEGWGFFYGRPATPVRAELRITPTNGHVAAKIERLAEHSDDVFRYVLTSLADAKPIGWTFHYRPVHPPLSDELDRALSFLRGFLRFDECPEFEFEECRWRYVHFLRGSTPFDSNAGDVHRAFQAHATHFALGLQALLDAHKVLEPFGRSLLPPQKLPVSSLATPPSTISATGLPDHFEVAISFAGAQREAAEALAMILRDSGVTVFYDNFYPEHLWGKDLVAFFDEIYRKRARYCVMFVSEDYAKRMWTNHERRSAQARALNERGEEYILPIRVDDSDLPGLPPTIGYLSLAAVPISDIAKTLLRKLGRA